MVNNASGSFLTDEMVLELQGSDTPLVQSWEGLVVYSDRLSRKMINQLAEEYADTVQKFEEIIYLIGDLDPAVVEIVCLQNKSKVTDKDIELLKDVLSTKALAELAAAQ